MQQIDTKKLIQTYGVISDQVEPNELRIILDECVGALENHGAIVEFGCYIGTTSLHIRRILDTMNDSRQFHVYDSFDGLPEKRKEDQSPLGEQFVSGELRVSKKQFVHEFKKAGLRTPIIHKGWFNELSNEDVPGSIVFAFLDGDYYESVMTPLKLITPKLIDGAIIVIDDYGNQALPGAAKAVDEWCRTQGKKVTVRQSLAIIHT